MHNAHKIGIIQNAPLTADFSGNLRTIVQGYRECLDHGATLVIAPATALCGPEPGALANRRSFLTQTQAALDALSHELGSTPLLLGASASLYPFGDDEWDELSNSGGVNEQDAEPDSCIALVPFLIEKDTVTELEDAAVTPIAGLNVYVDICDGDDGPGNGEILPFDSSFDLLVHLAATPWHINAAQQNEESRSWEARSNMVPVVCAQPVGTAGSTLYGGGSGIYTPQGKALLRLPFFEAANRVVSLAATAQARALPKPEDLLVLALTRGIRDSVRQNGYTAICLPLDHPNAPLLSALCAEAIGSANVHGVSFGSNEHAPTLASALGISLQRLDAAPVLAAAGAEEGSALATRLQAAMLVSQAEEREQMLLSPIGRHEVMLGRFTLYGESCGCLAPLGNLYRMDIQLLTQYLCERHPGICGPLHEPENPVQDRIIHELADRNIAASALLANNPILFTENEVRLVQRRIISSAQKRSQLPTILHVAAPSEQLTFPLCHRMND